MYIQVEFEFVRIEKPNPIANKKVATVDIGIKEIIIVGMNIIGRTIVGMIIEEMIIKETAEHAIAVEVGMTTRIM